VPELALSVSATTRQARPGETQGEHYHFISDEEFARHIADGDFVEWAEYSGRRYGTLREELDRHTSGGRPVVLEIEVQGARQVREAMPEAVLIFISPPDPAALRSRLEERGTDPDEEIERRLRTAEEELEAQAEFPHVVVNESVQEAAAELERLVREQLSLH
jgi:guanylate kinase